MTTRVYYINPEGRRTHKDVTAERDHAEALFGHLYPGCRVVSVEALGGSKAPVTAAPVVTLGPDDRPITDQDVRNVRVLVEELRDKLRPRKGK